MKKQGALLLTLVTLALTPSSPPALQAASATLRVSARVQPSITFDAVQNVRSYVVTAEGLKQGYVDVPGTATLKVRTNVIRPIYVNVTNQGPERIHIKSASMSEFISPSNQLNLGLQEPGVHKNQNLDCRVILPEGMREGVYPLLLAISLQAD